MIRKIVIITLTILATMQGARTEALEVLGVGYILKSPEGSACHTLYFKNLEEEFTELGLGRETCLATADVSYETRVKLFDKVSVIPNSNSKLVTLRGGYYGGVFFTNDIQDVICTGTCECAGGLNVCQRRVTDNGCFQQCVKQLW